MASKKSKLDKATDIVAKIIGEQLKTLPPAVAQAKRRVLHGLASRVSRACVPGKHPRHPQSAGLRLVSRSRAKTA